MPPELQMDLLDQTLTAQPVILVVEDEALIALHLEQVLTDAGYHVVVAFSGEEAIARSKTMGRLSALVTDINLQYGCDGRCVLRELRIGYPLLPAVFATGFSQWMDEADLRGLGGPTVRLVKPFLEKELIACVADVLLNPRQWVGERRGLALLRR